MSDPTTPTTIAPVAVRETCTNAVAPSSRNTVGWSYPSSPNADRLGFPGGCWTLERIDYVDGVRQPPVALQGVHSLADALALLTPEERAEWSRVEVSLGAVYAFEIAGLIYSRASMLRWNPDDTELREWMRLARPGDRFERGEGCTCVAVPSKARTSASWFGFGGQSK